MSGDETDDEQTTKKISTWQKFTNELILINRFVYNQKNNITATNMTEAIGKKNIKWAQFYI